MSDLLNRVNNFIGEYQIPNLQSENDKEQEDDSLYLQEDASKNKNYPFPANAFEIGKDDDGSIKYSFDNIYDDQELIRVAQDYFEVRDGVRYNAEDVVDEFISDRTWKQANTLSMMGELKYALNEETDVNQKERLAYLMQYWSKLPNFYAEGGRGWWQGLSSNVAAGMADPLNYVGGIFGGMVVKQGAKQVGKELLKKSVQKQVTKQTAIRATGVTAATDAAVFGGADAILQNTEMELGMRNEYDIGRTGVATVIGVGTTLLPTGVTSFFAAKGAVSMKAKKFGEPIIDDLEVKSSTGIKDVDDAINGRVADTNTKKNPLRKIEKGTPLVNRYERIKGYVFDKYNPMRVLQEKITGVQASVQGLKKSYANLKAKGYDPITNPYYMFRMLVGSNARADDFAKRGVMLPSDISAKEFKYTATGNKGFLEVVKPFNDKGHMETLLSYMGALRSNKIRENAVKIPVGRKRNTYLNNAMFTKADADKIIAYAELSPDQYFRKYKVKGDKPDLDFVTGARDLKKYFDDLLVYQVRHGVIDEKQLKAIQKAHPFYIPFYANGKISDAVDLHSQALTNSVTGIGAPAKKGMKGAVAKTNKEYKPLFESIIDYTYSAVLSADKNAAKRSFYRMIDEGVKNKVIEKNQIVREITGSTQLKNVRAAITKSAIDKLEDMGVKIDAADLDPNNTSFPVMAFADNIIDKANAVGVGAGQKIDIFYDNGKFRAFIIEDDSLASMYRTFDNNTNNILNKINKFTQPFARIPAQAITHSPPFIAYNMIRDTLSGSVNSAFGFKPFYTTIKGGLKTMQGVDNPKNVKSYRQMFERSDTYRQALVSGMGYSNRAQTEKYLTFGNKFSKTGTSPANAYYKKSLNWMHQNYAGVKPVAKGWTDFVSRVEYATRLGEFELAKKAGWSDVGAAFAAREIATDFGMGGSSRILNLYARNTMFFNAGLQGFYRGLRRAKENPKKFGAMVGITVVAPELMLWSLNNERREYEEVPDEVKQLNYLIPIFVDEQPDGSHKWPNGERRVERFIPIPKPYDFGVFGNIATGIAEAFQHNSSTIGRQYMWKSLNQIMPGSGFYRGGAPGTNIMGVSVPFIEEPGILRPWADIAFNHDWVGAKITPYGVEKIPPELRVKTNTRESIIKFAEFMKELTSPSGSNQSFLSKVPIANKLINPIEMDYIINSYFTGLLSYPLDVLDAMSWNEDRYGERPTRRSDEKDFFNAPWSVITKRFSVNTPVKASQNLRTLYDIKKKADEIIGADFKKENSYRYLLDITEMEEGYSNEKANQLRAVSSLLQEVMLQLAESRKLRDNVRFIKEMSADEKRLYIEELREAENEIAYQYLIALSSADFDKAMKTNFGGDKYKLPKEPDDIFGLRKLFGVE